MISIKYASIIAVAAFVSGSFVASPELRAYAANTVGSADIINNSIQSVDIKDGEVKTADIGTGAVASGRIADGAVGTLKIADDSITAADIKADAVGASELQGVSKLIFAECTVNIATAISVGALIIPVCNVPGVEVGDEVIVTRNGPASSTSSCFKLESAVSAANKVNILFRNECSISASLGTVKVAMIVYNT